MAIDDVVLPFPVSLGSKGGPMFDTVVVGSASGSEQRVAYHSSPRRKYMVDFSGHWSGSDLQRLKDFFLAREGKLRGCKLVDPRDFMARNQHIGTGDGATTQFQMTKFYPDPTNPRTLTLKYIASRLSQDYPASPGAADWAAAACTKLYIGAANDVWTITNTAAFSGSWTFSCVGQTSGALSVNSYAHHVANELAAMIRRSSYGDIAANSFYVHGGPLLEAPIVIEFCDLLGRTSITTTVDDSGVTGGGSVSIAHTTSAAAGTDDTSMTYSRSTGIITASAAPTLGQSVYASFDFHVPVRFNTDVMEITLEGVMGGWQGVELVELLNE